jgi:hypothetical protein
MKEAELKEKFKELKEEDKLSKEDRDYVKQ